MAEKEPKEEPRENLLELKFFDEMDPHIKSQLAFVFFCISSFVMLIIYIAIDEQIETRRAIAVINTSSFDNLERVRNSNALPKCLPVNHVAFLPMEESNSFLFKSLFIHNGLKHHQSFALPSSPTGSFINGLGHPFSPIGPNITNVIGYNEPGFEFDVLCQEMILDASKVYEIMPEDTKFIGLLINPMTHFWNLWNKHEPTWSMREKLIQNRSPNSTDKLEDMRTFLTDPWNYLQEPLDQYRDAEMLKNHKILHKTKLEYQPRISSLIHTRNPQLFTYGFEVVQKNLADVLMQSMISSVETQYHFILIEEYFDLNLVLLKHKLCWSYSAIVTIAASVKRPIEVNTTAQEFMDDDIKEKLRSFNKADFDFYDKMNATFWASINTIGKQRIKAINDIIVKQATQLQELCIESWEKVGHDHIPVIKPASKNLPECQRIELVRKDVTKTLQTRQKQLVMAHRKGREESEISDKEE